MKEIKEIVRQLLHRGKTFVVNLSLDVSTIFLHRFERGRWVLWANVFAALRGMKIRYLYDITENLYIAEENGIRRYFRSKALGYDFYVRGMDTRIQALAEGYFLERIPISDGDLVVDCGANIGDFLLYFNKKNIKIRYIGYEPSPDEFTALRKNTDFRHGVYNKGLWNQNSSLLFYVSSDGGDSSFIEPPSYTEKLDIPIVRLDSEVREPIKLLKLEAEGAEPEVLEGCGDLLNRIEYITADLGPERGVSKESTLVPVINFLLARNFELLEVGHSRIVALFRNRDFR